MTSARVVLLSVDDFQWRLAPGRRFVPSEIALEATADTAGAWRVDGVSRGRCRVVVSARGHSTEQSFVEVPASGHVAHDVVLAGGGRLSGTVRSAAGVLLAGVKVEVLADGSAFVESDAEGRFEITGLRRGTDHIAVADGGEAGRATHTFTLGEADACWNPTLDVGRSIEGYLRDELGRPLAGLHVVIRPVSSQDSTPSRPSWFVDRGQLTTDDHGRFFLSNCGEGLHTIHVHRAPGEGGHDPSAGFAGVPCASLTDVAPSPSPLHIEIETHERYMTAVHWRIVDASGEPVVGAHVDVQLVQGDSNLPPRQRFRVRMEASDPRGECVARNVLLRGYEARISAEGFAESVVTLDLRGGSLPPDPPHVTVTLSRE